jgi:hypothetical protein
VGWECRREEGELGVVSGITSIRGFGFWVIV